MVPCARNQSRRTDNVGIDARARRARIPVQMMVTAHGNEHKPRKLVSGLPQTDNCTRATIGDRINPAFNCEVATAKIPVRTIGELYRADRGSRKATRTRTKLEYTCGNRCRGYRGSAMSMRTLISHPGCALREVGALKSHQQNNIRPVWISRSSAFPQ